MKQKNLKFMNRLDDIYFQMKQKEFSPTSEKNVKKMFEVMAQSDEDEDVLPDFEDIEQIMSLGDKFDCVLKSDNGINAASATVKQIIDDFEVNMKKSIVGILVYFITTPNLPLMKIADTMEIVHDYVKDEAYILWGGFFNKSLSPNYVKTVILVVR